MGTHPTQGLIVKTDLVESKHRPPHINIKLNFVGLLILVNIQLKHLFLFKRSKSKCACTLGYVYTSLSETIMKVILK